MTCYLAIEIAERLKIDLNTYQIRVSKCAASMCGTSAKLREGETLTLFDLLHGLMLPSGNDAAVAIAESLGRELKIEKESSKVENGQEQLPEGSCKSSYAYFIEAMNQKAKELELTDTHFENPHGLMHKNNVSSAYDLALLCTTVMKNELFRKIVRKKEHFFWTIQGVKIRREGMWENTNKLLSHGYEGIKTGTTPTAGYCLASSLRRSEMHHLICILLNASATDARFSESRKLIEFGFRKLVHKS